MTANPYVLLVDDDPDARETLLVPLTRAGYRVVTAANGEEAIQRLCDPGPSPDLILLDLHMPGMDGLQFRRIQQQYLRWATIPVVVVSAHVAPHLASQLQVPAVLTKGAPTEELLATVEQYRRRSTTP